MFTVASWNFTCIVFLENSFVLDSRSGSTKKGNLDYMHFDVWLPIKDISMGGSRYFVTLTDDFSYKD